MCRGERNVYWKVRKTFTLIKMYQSRIADKTYPQIGPNDPEMVSFLVVEPTHPSSNNKFDMGVVFTTNCFFVVGDVLSTARRSW
jgi:hypothetical protein